MSTARAHERPKIELWVALAALAVAAGGVAMFLLGSSGPTSPNWSAVGQILGSGLAPSLLVVALARWLWRLGMLSTRVVVITAVLGVGAFWVGYVALLSGQVSFSEADTGAPTSLFGGLFLAFLGISWLLGAISIFLALFTGVTRLVQPGPIKLVISIVFGVVGLVGAPIIGVTFLSPFAAALTSVAFVVLLLIVGGRRSSEGGVPTSDRSSAPSIGSAPLALAWASAGLGTVAVGFALSGSTWLPAPARTINGTSAMGYGIAAGLLGSIPLVLAVAMAIARRWPRQPVLWSTWIPAGSICAALVAAAVTSVQNALTDGAGSMLGWNLLAISLLLFALGIALYVATRMPLRGTGRVAASALIGIGIASTIGFVGAFAFPFVAPLLAFALAIWVFPRMNRAGLSDRKVSAAIG